MYYVTGQISDFKGDSWGDILTDNPDKSNMRLKSQKIGEQKFRYI